MECGGRGKMLNWTGEGRRVGDGEELLELMRPFGYRNVRQWISALDFPGGWPLGPSTRLDFVVVT